MQKHLSPQVFQYTLGDLDRSGLYMTPSFAGPQSTAHLFVDTRIAEWCVATM